MNERGISSIRGVSKYFGAVHVVDKVDLEIQRGEFFSLLGPSGCGKTTLLRMLAGFEAPSEGEIYIDGQPMAAIPAYRRPVTMVFQNYAIFPHLDVRGNIAFGLRKSGLSKAEINAKVDAMLNMIKLPGDAGRGVGLVAPLVRAQLPSDGRGHLPLQIRPQAGGGRRVGRESVEGPLDYKRHRPTGRSERHAEGVDSPMVDDELHSRPRGELTANSDVGEVGLAAHSQRQFNSLLVLVFSR